MDSSLTPIVIGPNLIPYIVDDHHTLCALDQSGFSSTIVNFYIVCNWSYFTNLKDFYSQMIASNFLYDLGRQNEPNQLPVIIDPTLIPSTIQKLPDDPW